MTTTKWTTKRKTAFLSAAFFAAFAVACGDLKQAGRMALRDASMATPQTQEAYRRAQTAIEEIDADDERALGEAVALRIIDGTQSAGALTGIELRDRELAAYVANVGNLVALHGRRQVFPPRKTPRIKARRFVFSVLDTDGVGAYSTPGGYIFVTRGLLSRLTSESELAWVLAHEIAHVDYEDGLIALKADMATKTALGSMGESLKGKKEAGKSEFDDNQPFFNAVVDRFYDMYDRTGLNKEHELRSDRVGLEYATNAGYDGDGAMRALTNLELGRGVGGFMTHGSRRQRIEAMGNELLEKKGKAGGMRYDRMALARLDSLSTKVAAAVPVAAPTAVPVAVPTAVPVAVPDPDPDPDPVPNPNPNPNPMTTTTTGGTR